ncbi:MAG TPA: hypothetical protein VLE53_17170 [Gemmatimonadaceae bacterium]|nr:hypothetical protein [Gemmatimonadaceae bacterium]
MLTVFVILSAAACADFTGGIDPTYGLPDVVVEDPDYLRDVVPIFERRCALGGCHSPGSAQAGLVLTRDAAHQMLVDAPARLRPGEVRVVPFDAASSWLMVMIGEEQAPRGGFSRMPLGSNPLTPNQIATIANWIDRGAGRE